MAYGYKRLDQNDTDQLREMLDVFAVAFDDEASYKSKQPIDGYLRELLAKPHFIAIAAMGDSGEVVGALAGYVLEKFEQARSEIYVYDLAVLEEHRRKGIATGLINEVRKVAKQVGAYVIFLQADYGDEPAIALYEKLGVKEEVMHFDIPIDGKQ